MGTQNSQRVDSRVNKLLVLVLIFVAVWVVSLGVCETTTNVIEVTVPDYLVKKIGGWDYVEIPGGEDYLVEGMPIVPCYSVTVDYPKGIRVQRVFILERSEMTIVTNLNLSTATETEYLPRGAELPSSTEDGWYPDKDYFWKTWVNSDGSSTLLIAMLPLYYNTRTSEVRFYRKYVFNIIYIYTSISIVEISIDKPICDPGENITAEVVVVNREGAEDIIVSSLIKRYGSEEVVHGLPLWKLVALSGEASFALTWSTNGIPTGDYYLEVMLNDTAGNWLGTRTQNFRVGRPFLNVTNFYVTPKNFDIGQEVEVVMEVLNIGSTSISCRCFFNILESGARLSSLQQDVYLLEPSKSHKFTYTWNTSSAVKGKIYYIVAYVSYDGQTTTPMSAIVSTNLFPIARISFSPQKAGIGEVVAFDASGSFDPDGELKSFFWDFGDGTNASSSRTTHCYYEPGFYEVMLTVMDKDGACNSTRGIINVVMSYVLNVSSNIEVVLRGAGIYKEGDEVTLSAPTYVTMSGLLGLLGAKYNFVAWSGPFNSTENTINITFSGYEPKLEFKAIYVEDYSLAILIVAILSLIFAAITSIVMFRRKRRTIAT